MDDDLYRLHAELEESYWWFVAKNRIIVAMIDRFYPPSQREGDGGRVQRLGSSSADASPLPRPRLCDIGCGCGGLLKLLAPRFDVTGIDMSPTARAYCKARGFDAHDGYLPDGLPFRPGSRGGGGEGLFDVIVMSEVLEHVEGDRDSVITAASLLAPGGLLVCTVPAHPWMWSRHDELNHHFRRYRMGRGGSGPDGFAALFDGLPLERLVLSPMNSLMFLPMAGVRWGKRVLGVDRGQGADKAGDENGEDHPAIRPLPRPLNALLRELFAAERHLLARRWGGTLPNPPCGSSLIAVHRRLSGPIHPESA